MTRNTGVIKAKGLRTYMVTWERLALNDDFVSFLSRLIEARHQQMQISGQSIHDRNLALTSSHNWCHVLRAGDIDVDERGQQFIVMRGEMPRHAFDSPCPEIPINEFPSISRLDSQRVSTEVDASRVGGVVRICGNSGSVSE